MSFINTQLFDTALSPQDQLDEQLAQSSLAGPGAQLGDADRDDGIPQELGAETFTDLTQASQAQISQEEFFDEDTPETIDDQEMMSTLTSSVSASLAEYGAEALMQVSPDSALSLL